MDIYICLAPSGVGYTVHTVNNIVQCFSILIHLCKYPQKLAPMPFPPPGIVLLLFLTMSLLPLAQSLFPCSQS